MHAHSRRVRCLVSWASPLNPLLCECRPEPHRTSHCWSSFSDLLCQISMSLPVCDVPQLSNSPLYCVQWAYRSKYGWSRGLVGSVCFTCETKLISSNAFLLPTPC